jgi:hypothetical protein
MNKKQKYQKEWRKKNKKILAIKKKQHYLENIDHYKQYQKLYYEQNKEKIKVNVKKYRKKRPDIPIKVNRLYRQKYKEKILQEQKEKRREYPEKNRAYARIGYKNLRDKKCVKCGKRKDLHFHHTNYKNDKGFTLCRKCHYKIHNEVKK